MEQRWVNAFSRRAHLAQCQKRRYGQQVWRRSSHPLLKLLVLTWEQNVGNNEHRCIIRDALGFYGSVVTVGTYAADVDVSMARLRDNVVIALKHCILEHPVLACLVQGRDTERPCLFRAKDIDVSHHIHFADELPQDTNDDKALEILLRRVHAKPHATPDIHPQWHIHVQILSHSASSARIQIAFGYSHSLLDGRSGLLFHKAFLDGLNAPVEQDVGSETAAWQPTIQKVIPPAMEDAGRLHVSWSFLLGPLIREYLPQPVARFLGVHTGPTEEVWRGASSRPPLPASSSLVSTSVVVGTLSYEILGRVLKVCKRRQVKLTGLLIHVIAKALSEALNSRGKIHRCFHVSTAIDLRNCLGAAHADMACYPSTVGEDVSADPSATDLDWLAIQRSTELLAHQANTPNNQPVALLKYLGDYKAWTLKRATQPASGSFEVSNLGTFDGSTAGGPWRITDMAFSQSADATGDPFSVNVASAKGGALNMIITWLPGMLGIEDEDTFMRDLCGRLIGQMSNLARV